MQTLTQKKTYQDYADTPEGAKFQLINGEIIEMTSPTPNHQRIVLEIALSIKEYIKKYKAGKCFIAPLDVKLKGKESGVVKSIVLPDLELKIEEVFG